VRCPAGEKLARHCRRYHPGLPRPRL
jgi:hypothetical protein